jgi:hypothetical protein
MELDQEQVESTAAGGQVPSGMILFPRRVFYVEAALYLVVAAAAFLAGYFMGRGDTRYREYIRMQLEAQQRIYVPGRILRHVGNRPAADEGAVVLALPAGKFPTERLPPEGIRPSLGQPRGNSRTTAAVLDLGGALEFADAAGKFGLNLPVRGKYHILIISAHVRRPADQSLPFGDVKEMEPYFQDPRAVVQESAYRWTLRELNLGANPLEVDFGGQ